MNISKLESLLKEFNQPGYRAKQVQKAVFQDGVASFAEITTLSKQLREQLSLQMEILSFGVERVLVSADGQSIKALLKLGDGHFIETVLIAPKPGIWSACISCQVGCPLGCGFCATGKGAFQRDLTAEEITDQVLFWKQWIIKNQNAKVRSQNSNSKCEIKDRPAKLDNIVYMGMGEPFLNWENVKESLKILTDSNLFGFGSRSISVSTAGIPEGIEKFAQEFLQINLALSLHFATNEKRSQYMPINRKYDLESLKNALQKYFQKTKRKVFLEYLLLEHINDSDSDAQKLVEYINSIGYNHLLHVNLIRYNAIGNQLVPSSKEATIRFKKYFLQNRIHVTIRKGLGSDIQGACGQLAGKKG